MGKEELSEDLVTYLYSSTWMERVELFSLVLASVIRTHYKENVLLSVPNSGIIYLMGW